MLAHPRSSTFSLLRRFSNDNRGSVVLTFVMLLVPIVVVTIGAIDYGRATSRRQLLQSAIDSGLSFAANRFLEEDAVIEEAFSGAFRASLPEFLRDTPVTIGIDKQNFVLTAEARSTVPVHIIGLIKGNRFEIAASGQLSVLPPKIAKPAAPPPEVARQAEDVRRQIGEILGRLDGQLDAIVPPQMQDIDRAEIERMAQEILQRYGR